MRTIVVTFICLWTLQASGQELVFSEPVKLGSQINSDDEELAPMLSSDGKTLYFSRAFHNNNMGGKYAGSDIWVSKKDDKGNWMPAANMSNQWNNKRSNAVIGVNHDHTVVYLLNAYSNKSGISFSKLNSGIWGKTEFIPIPGINRDDFVGIYVHPDFDVIMISMRGVDSNGEEDLYVSLKDSFSNWTTPKNLGPTINTKGFEISPFLSLDKKRLFFSSNGHQGFGDADIFYCDRLFDSWETWGVPKNLGDMINSKYFDGYFLNTDSISFFSSNRGGINSHIFYSFVDSKKNLMRDSVKRLVSDATKILDELKSPTENDVILKFIEYSTSALSIPKAELDIIAAFVKKYDPLRKGEYELTFYLESTINSNRQSFLEGQSRNLVDFLVANGINTNKIIKINGKESIKTGVQIRLFLK